MTSLSENAAAVLLAVSYAQQRWTDANLQDIVNQMRAPRLQSGLDLLPNNASGSTIERQLTSLRRAGLIDSVPAVTRSGRRWIITEAGAAEIARATAAWKAAVAA